MGIGQRGVEKMFDSTKKCLMIYESFEDERAIVMMFTAKWHTAMVITPEASDIHPQNVAAVMA